MMKTEIGKVSAIFTRMSPYSELFKCNLVNKVKIGMILTWPGIAKPIENIAKRTFPVMVIERAIAKATMLANRIVINTEKTATNTEFLKGVQTFPVAMRVLKLLRFQCLGRAKGLV
jgi:hypothetical protein